MSSEAKSRDYVERDTSVIDRVGVVYDGDNGKPRLTYLNVEIYPDGTIGNVRNLIGQLTQQNAGWDDFSREFGRARKINISTFMDSYGDTLVEEGCPPFKEAIKAYIDRHGAEKYHEVLERLHQIVI